MLPLRDSTSLQISRPPKQSQGKPFGTLQLLSHCFQILDIPIRPYKFPIQELCFRTDRPLLEDKSARHWIINHGLDLKRLRHDVVSHQDLPLQNSPEARLESTSVSVSPSQITDSLSSNASAFGFPSISVFTIPGWKLSTKKSGCS